MRIESDADYLLYLDGFIDGVGSDHFSAAEACPVGRVNKGVRLARAPLGLLPNLRPTLAVAEWLRAKAGAHPLGASSVYRDPAYNRSVGGATNSLHVAFNAMDLRSAHVSALKLGRLLLTHPEADQLGIGVYGGFVHLDTRGMIGRPAPARWSGEGVGRWWT